MSAAKNTSEIPPFWQNDGLPIGVAHRGGDAAGIEKENSIAAFQAAWDMGFRHFETDGVPTKDNRLLAVHGRGLQRDPNKDLLWRRQIQAMTYDETRDKLIGGEYMPLMEELLSTFPGGKWFIDPKVNASVSPLVSILKQRGRNLDNISVGAFSQARIDSVVSEIKEATGKDLCTSIGPIGAMAILGASDVKLSKISTVDSIAYNIMRGLHRLPSAEEAVRKTGATSLNIPYGWINESTNLAELAHGLGLHLATWTPNERVDIEQSVQKGADAIMSDRLSILRDVLKDHTPNNPSISH